MSRITELNRAESLPVGRCVFPVRNGLLLLWLMLAVLLCVDLSASESGNESVLTRQLKSELAYLKTQTVLTTDVVNRYRNLYLEMPAHLTSEERDALDQYLQEYSRLRKAAELAKAEKTFARYEQLEAERQRTIAEERARQIRFQKAPVPETKKNIIIMQKMAAADAKRKAAAAKAQAEARKKAVAEANERRNVEIQIKREFAALYPRAYALTSKRILVTSAKEKDKYASEFANAVKLFDDWQKKWADQAKRNPHLAGIISAQTNTGAVKQTIILLKECQAIHELAYKGGTKMKGARLDRYRIVSTNWQGIEYADAGNHYQSRLKAANLNSAVKMRLIAHSARRLKKNTQALNGIPLLAYYHMLTGNADIVVRMNHLTDVQKQDLIAYFKNWDLPEKEIQILRKPVQKKAEPDGNDVEVERF